MTKKLILRTMMLVLVLLPFYSAANITQKTTMTTAYGKTYQDALQQALTQSIGQVKGVSIDAVCAIFNKLSVTNGVVVIDGVQMPVESYLNSQGFISAIRSATGGVIDSYRVQKSVQKDKIWTVTVEVTYSEYTSLVSKKEQQKNTLAILPFQFSPGSVSGELNPLQLRDLLYQDIQNKLTASSLFRVMDRSNIDQKAYEKEMALILSNRTSSEQKARFGAQVGADYLLVGNVQRLVFKKVKKDFYGGDFSQWHVQMTVNYRLLETATMQVLKTDNIRTSISPNEVNKILQDPMNTKDDVLNRLVSEAASQLAESVSSYQQLKKQ
ncbi:CsgG/HfaB family protein [Fangia hongkongensis]|uniref:CsgG/HfaB family protein n=1 Tax=Fangia hongkongensis TaxID=270495 RepID=UPI00036B718E|nr:CsgG/HfaB family protein [Fangia hongkongensis]MBK2123644.1 hypothetical protein [Fangia hongkongensis]